MIKAELIHNPYLLETTVRFNGKEPRINCQIEKYENQALNITPRLSIALRMNLSKCIWSTILLQSI